VWLTEPGLYAFQLVVHAGGRRSAPDTVHVAVLEPTSCTVTGAEQCNGVDDDCDGATDEDLEPPSADLHEGVCVGARRRCDGAAGWIEPDYGAIEAYEPTELSCDGLDNDCDGLADEGFDADGDGVPDCLQCSLLRFPLLGQPCDPGGGCPAARWACLERAGAAPELSCEPSLHLVDRVPCGRFERSAAASLVRDVSGSLAWVGPDEPRFEYDDLVGAPAMLLEGERVSYVRSSGFLTGANWRLVPEEQGPELVDAPFAAPDGGDALALLTHGPNEALYQRALVARAGSTLSLSVYLRRADATASALALEVGGGDRLALLPVPGVWERATVQASWPPEEDLWAHLILNRLEPAAGVSQIAIWGPQVEAGAFPSSYFVTRGDGGVRPEDRLSLPAELFGEERGSLTLWMLPRYPAGVRDPGPRVAAVDGWLECGYVGEREAVRCEVGDRELAVDAAGFGPDGWSFVALTLSGRGGLDVYLGVAGELRHTTLPGPLALPPLQGQPIHPLPLFARSRDLRLYPRRLDPTEVEALYLQDLPSYP